MKTNAILRICIYSLLLILLIGLLLGSLTGFRGFSHHFRTGRSSEVYTELDPFTSQKSFDPQSFTKLEINWLSGNIRIQRTDADRIVIGEVCSDDAKPTVVAEKNGTLKIEYSEGEHIWFGIHNSPSKDLIVSVPRDFTLRELDLDVASSKVTILDLTIDEMEFDGASGELILKDCTVGDLDIDTASGDVTFSGSLQTLDMDAASADFRGVFENCPRRLALDGASGALDVTLPKGSGFTARVDGLSCNFSSTLPVTTSNGAYVCGDGACVIDADGMSMDVTVRYAE